MCYSKQRRTTKAHPNGSLLTHGTNLSVLHQIMASKGLKKGTLGKQNNARNNLNRRVVYGIYCHKHGTREKGASYMLYTPFKFVSIGVLLELNVRRRKIVSCGHSWCLEDPGDVQVVAVWFHDLAYYEVARQANMMRYWFGRPWKACYEMCSARQLDEHVGVRARPSAAPGHLLQRAGNVSSML